jgi:DnaJ-class molecular chaperone
MTSTASKDYYAILGVPRNADEKQVRAAYRRLARKHHPDLNPGDPTAEQRFKEIGEAYEVLSDPKKRQLYDRFGANWQQAQRMQEQGIPFDKADTAQGFPGGFGGFNVDFGQGGFGDLFENLFGGAFGRAGAGGFRQRPTARADVQVTLEEAYRGATRVLELPMDSPCAACNASGRVNGRACPTCGGRRAVRTMRRVEATIPPGVDTGSQLRITPAGQDVVLVVSVLPDPRFRREDADLYTAVSVPLYTALLGGEVKVPTPKGQVSLTIPPETANSKVFRLSGQGMPVLGDPVRRGNLYVTANVELPGKLTPKEKELLQQLKSLRAI